MAALGLVMASNNTHQDVVCPRWIKVPVSANWNHALPSRNGESLAQRALPNKAIRADFTAGFSGRIWQVSLFERTRFSARRPPAAHPKPPDFAFHPRCSYSAQRSRARSPHRGRGTRMPRYCTTSSSKVRCRASPRSLSMLRDPQMLGVLAVRVCWENEPSIASRRTDPEWAPFCKEDTRITVHSAFCSFSLAHSPPAADIRELRRLADKHGPANITQMICATDSMGRNALHVACEDGDDDVIRNLIKVRAYSRILRRGPLRAPYLPTVRRAQVPHCGHQCARRERRASDLRRRALRRQACAAGARKERRRRRHGRQQPQQYVPPLRTLRGIVYFLFVII